MVQTRTADRPHGPCRVYAPLSSTETDDGKGGEWERAVLHGHVPEHPTPQAAGTEYFSLDVEDVPADGSRPDRLAGVRPQVRVLERTVQQIVDPVSWVPLLHDVEPHMAEQPAEVPTILYLLKQTVDTPVPRRGGVEGQQGFLPGQSSSSSAEQIADIPVSGGRRHGLSPDLHLAALPAVLPGEPVQGFFRTFPQHSKKCTCRDASECEGAWALELIRAECSSNP